MCAISILSETVSVNLLVTTNHVSVESYDMCLVLQNQMPHIYIFKKNHGIFGVLCNVPDLKFLTLITEETKTIINSTTISTSFYHFLYIHFNWFKKGDTNKKNFL